MRSTEVVWHTSPNGIHGSTAKNFSLFAEHDFNGSSSSPTVKLINCLHISYTLM